MASPSHDAEEAEAEQQAALPPRCCSQRNVIAGVAGAGVFKLVGVVR